MSVHQVASSQQAAAGAASIGMQKEASMAALITRRVTQLHWQDGVQQQSGSGSWHVSGAFCATHAQVLLRIQGCWGRHTAAGRVSMLIVQLGSHD